MSVYLGIETKKHVYLNVRWRRMPIKNLDIRIASSFRPLLLWLPPI